MNMKAIKEARVDKKQLTEEMWAMIETCFEGTAIMYEGNIRMRLPSGELFLIEIKEEK